MQTTEESRASTPQLKTIRTDVSPEVEQACSFSRFYIHNYFAEHVGVHPSATAVSNEVVTGEASDGVSLDVASLLATGRLDWLLQKTRPSLNGLLTQSDFAILLDCYQGNIFFPDQFECIASDLCDHSGVEFELYGTSALAPLVDKLLDLNPMQKVALADALEQTWNRGMKQNKSPKEFLITLGIELAC